MKKSEKIISTNISVINFNDVLNLIKNWVNQKESKYVCICNTHSVVTASNDKHFKEALETADLCTADGMPLVWVLKHRGHKNQDRVDGPNLMKNLCEFENYRVFLYGSKKETLDKLEKELKILNKGLEIVGKISPPFRELENNEEREFIHQINSTNPDLIFVGLGCPKQEIWMYKNRNNINGVMIGVGAAFDYLTGNIKRAPLFIQRIGLEWLFRLIQDPKRLWKRYLYNNTMFVLKIYWKRVSQK
ncbi:WecB/TagA/CpsF family glycosyltransferase [Neobacillus sp. NRS-1170]|uniref:WecB/TagA/CpsF family glycosyltransferase n=1 Tax=Neobacillus sp. NRS-1170 TaxID=3233898 RepID=UPI003D280170